MFFQPIQIKALASALKRGEIGLFPCDTVLGIIAIASDDNCRKIQAIKQRDSVPFLCLMSSMTQVESWAKPLSETQKKHCQNYWPGPMTFIMEKQDHVSAAITGSKPTVAMRIPEFLPLKALLDEINEPLLSTSANRHGQAVAHSVSDCDPDIKNQCDWVYDALPPLSQKASTIVDLTQNPEKIIRQGGQVFEPL